MSLCCRRMENWFYEILVSEHFGDDLNIRRVK